MTKQKLDFHSSLLIAYSEEGHKILLSVYDQGYPKVIYRGSANLVGGNRDPNDKSPEDVLIRELSEEFNPNHGLEKKFVGMVDWATCEDIRSTRNSLFNLTPLQDFVIRQPRIGDQGEENIFDNGINSVYFAFISREIMDIVERNIQYGKNIVAEGNVGVFSLEQLEKNNKGIYSTAWATAPILNCRFGSNISYSKNFRIIETMGMPRKSFEDYDIDFEYDIANLKKAAKADL